MGAFDDLIPGNKPEAGSGTFDDLVPKATVGGALKNVGASAIESFGSIFQGGGEAVAAGLNAVTGGQQFRATNPLKGVAEALRESMSAGDKAAMADQAKGDLLKPDTWALPETAGGYIHSAANVIGSLAPTVATALLTRGHMGPAMAAQGGLMTGGAAAGDVRENVGKLDDASLAAASPRFRELVAAGVSPGDARAKVENESAQMSGLLSGAAGAAGGAVNARLLEDLIAKKGIPALIGEKFAQQGVARTLTGAGLGAVGEGLQETAEKVGQNAGENVGMGKSLTDDITRDTLGDFVGGAIGGKLTGGVGGYLSKPGVVSTPTGGQIDPAAGPISSAAVTAVNSGAAQREANTKAEAEATQQQGEASKAVTGKTEFTDPQQWFESLNGTGQRTLIEKLEGDERQTALDLMTVARNPEASEPIRARAAEMLFDIAQGTGFPGVRAPVSPLALPAPQKSQEAIAQANIDEWSKGSRPMSAEVAEHFRSLAEAEGKDLRVVPHSSGEGFTVVPAAWVGNAATEGGGVLPSPQSAVAGGPMLGASDGTVRPQTYGDLDTQANRSIADAKDTLGPHSSRPAQVVRNVKDQTDVSTKVEPGAQEGEYISARQVGRASFPFKSRQQADARAETASQQFGEPYAVIDHPTAKGSFAVVPQSNNIPRTVTSEKSGAAETQQLFSETPIARGVDRESAEGRNFAKSAETTVTAAPQAKKLLTGPVDEAAHDAATSPNNDRPEPTLAQIEAGNYKKGHVTIGGLGISVENPSGSTRSGTSASGKAWQTTMRDHYGYIKRTTGADKDQVDVFVKGGTQPDHAGDVYVVDQVDPKTGKFDEHKAMLGYRNMMQAAAAYRAHYAKGWKGMGAITPMPMDEFKAWVKSPDAAKPLALDKKPSQLDGVWAVGRRIGGKFTVWRHRTDLDGTIRAEHLQDDRTKEDALFDTKAQAQSAIKSMTDTKKTALPSATAPEHVTTGVDDRELGQIVKEFNTAQDSMRNGDDVVTHIFDNPKKSEIVRLNDKAKAYVAANGWMTPDQAKAEIAKWKEAARAQGADPAIRRANSQKVVLSLFDLSGEWSKPWVEAGYQVHRFDIQDDPDMGDVNNFSVEFFDDWFSNFEGQDIHAILAACPCTDFAVSGARHFAAKDADGRTVSSVKLVHQTLRAIEYFKPALWSLENPVGRIEQLGGLPNWRLSFDPNHLGDTYTKKTLIWGRFNPDLPVAPVEATEGSKMHTQYGGKSMATKNARSVTPEGFSYGFFAANNAHDHPAMALANKFDRLDRGLIKQALDAGIQPDVIEEAVSDPYYMDLDDAVANQAIRDLLPSKPNGGMTKADVDLVAESVAKVNDKPEVQASTSSENNLADKKAEVVTQQQIVETASAQSAEPENAESREAEKSAAIPDAETVSAKSQKIQDVGEKIGGARKDKWKESGLAVADLDAMSESEGATIAKKANVWKPHYTKMVADGADPQAAALVKIVYDSLAAQPKDDTPAGRRRYVNTMQAVREVYSGVKTEADVKAARATLLYDHLKWTMGGAGSNEKASRNSVGVADLRAHHEESRRNLFAVYKGRSDPFVITYNERQRAAKLLESGFPDAVTPWTRRFDIRELGSGKFRVSSKDGTLIGYADTRADAEAKAVDAYARTKSTPSSKAEPERPHLDSILRKGMAQSVDHDVTADELQNDFGFRGIEFGNWTAQDERQRIMNMAYDALSDLATVLKVPPKAIGLNGTMGMAFGARGGGKFAAHYEPGKLVINITKLRGAGSLAHEWAHAFDHYLGEYERSDAYQGKARGASGWYDEQSYDGVPKKRMVQKSRTEWETVEQARLPNLRPELATEIDAVMQSLYKAMETKADMVRESEASLEKAKAQAAALAGNPDAQAVYQRRVDAQTQALEELRKEPESKLFPMGRSKFAANAQALSGRSTTGYWTRPTEMFARAFESYVFDRIADMGARSDFLVHSVEGDRYAGTEYKGNPYPTGSERSAINTAFDALVAEIKTKETEDGNVAMFNKTSGTATAFDKLLHAGIAEGRTATDTLKAIQKASKNAFYRELAGVLLKAGVNPKLEVGTSKGLKFSVKNRAAESFAAAFFPTENKVRLFTDVNAERNVLHEIMHAATVHAIRKRSLASGQLRALFSHVKKSGKLKGVYGMENMDEFIAEAFSNPKFQAALKGVSAATLRGGKLGHAFDWFVRIVRGILGLKPGQESALSQVIDIGTALIDQQRNMTFQTRASGKAMGNVRSTVDAMPAFDNASGNYNPDLPKFWIDKAKKDINGDVMGNIAEDARPAVQQVRQRVNDVFATKKTFNWWNNTVGTQYEKAEKDADFKRVFDATQSYIGDVSKIANAAADQAPTLLPKLDSFRDLIKREVPQADRDAIAKPIYQGTLTDQRVYSDAELRGQFGLNDQQVALYREFRAAIDKSLDDLAKTDLLRYVGKDARAVRGAVLNAGTASAAAEIVAQHLEKLGNTGDVDAIRAKAARVEQLKGEGYAPLMRFGKYAVYTTDKDGATIAFTLHETEREASKVARQMREQNPGADVVQSVMSEEAHKLYAGMEPETLELFAEMSGMESTPAFQEYLKLTKSNRSAMKRLIERKGIAGFEQDAVRTLAAFITSNARAASKNLHYGDMMAAAAEIPREKGDVLDEAVKLIKYVQNPQEEAQALRGLLFVNYIGGSVASALVNMTQPVTMTYPYLAQFGAAAAAKELTRAMRLAAGKQIADPELVDALARAEADGVVSPQEIFQLEAEASRKFGSNQYVRKTLHLWGSMFSLAEQFNRRATFIAAYNMAKSTGMPDAFAFAEKAVQETQGIYNRGNRPNRARGAIGATVFTFKQFSISYLEFLKRLPNREKGIALGILLLTAGIQGLPGADDLDDLIDTLGQHLGYDTNAKLWKTQALTAALGRDAAEFVMRGTSAIPGVPIDIAGRMSVGNLVPGSAMLLKSKQNKVDEVFEVFGAAGGVFKDALSGKFSPTAIRNLDKALDMYQTGMYRDEGGRKVMDVDGYDALMKGIGFQPATVARNSRVSQLAQQQVALVRATETEIVKKWAQGIFENKPEKVAEAVTAWQTWNRKNPGSPIAIKEQQIARSVMEMMTEKEDRIIKRAPKEMRAQVAELYQ